MCLKAGKTNKIRIDKPKIKHQYSFSKFELHLDPIEEFSGAGSVKVFVKNAGNSLRFLLP